MLPPPALWCVVTLLAPEMNYWRQPLPQSILCATPPDRRPNQEPVAIELIWTAAAAAAMEYRSLAAAAAPGFGNRPNPAAAAALNCALNKGLAAAAAAAVGSRPQ
ncbi:hypothetical protein GQX74_009823 [Glossina fuscipes]|uniref:Uncharacterized protein n=1 Tax=Glossina palpalis gambiensis TaxID=67801 RepID=A0A1B0AZK1_9MUSC|nr:hypothetical protein GQX74_009823 [Glossina fuscipes]